MSTEPSTPAVPSAPPAIRSDSSNAPKQPKSEVATPVHPVPKATKRKITPFRKEKIDNSSDSDSDSAKNTRVRWSDEQEKIWKFIRKSDYYFGDAKFWEDCKKMINYKKSPEKLEEQFWNELAPHLHTCFFSIETKLFLFQKCRIPVDAPILRTLNPHADITLDGAKRIIKYEMKSSSGSGAKTSREKDAEQRKRQREDDGVAPEAKRQNVEKQKDQAPFDMNVLKKMMQDVVSTSVSELKAELGEELEKSEKRLAQGIKLIGKDQPLPEGAERSNPTVQEYLKKFQRFVESLHLPGMESDEKSIEAMIQKNLEKEDKELDLKDFETIKMIIGIGKNLYSL